MGILIKITLLLVNLILAGMLIMDNSYSLGVFFSFLFIYQIYLYMTIKGLGRLSYFARRGKVATVILNFIVLAIIARLINIQIINGEMYASRASSQVETKYTKSGKRGEILDINGKKLALNTNVYEVGIDPRRVYGNEDAVEALREMKKRGFITADVDKILEEVPLLAVKESKYKLIEKRVDELKRSGIEQIISEKKKQNKLKNKEIFYTAIPERKYVKNDLYKTIVGNIGYAHDEKGENKIGVFGIEKQYNDYLKEKKLDVAEYFTKKRDIKLPTNNQTLERSLDGKDIYLTIDDEINTILNNEVEKQFKDTDSEEAYGIVMDPSSGRILGMASYTKLKKSVRNPLIQDQFEPGSTFKPLIVAAAMEEKYINEKTKFDVKEGTINKFGKNIKESSRSTRGVLTLEEILKKSSNVGMVLIAEDFTDEKFEEWLKKFGLYEKTGVDFPNELKPYAPSYKRWDRLKKFTMSFGQGIVMTPVQLASAFSAVINGGTLYRPYLVDRIEDGNGIVIRRNLPKVLGNIISPAVSKKVKGMMENTVEEGTGKNARVNGYKVGGKTGTGQLAAPWGGYYKNEYLASFIGFFPVENPQYVIYTMFLKPQGTTTSERYGGSVGAPVFREVVSGITKAKDISTITVKKIDDEDDSIDEKKNIAKTVETKKNSGSKKESEMKPENAISEGIVPDLKGKNSKEILTLFQGKKINIEMIGTGVAVKQSPEPGTDLELIKIIKIWLEVKEERKK